MRVRQNRAGLLVSMRMNSANFIKLYIALRIVIYNVFVSVFVRVFTERPYVLPSFNVSNPLASLQYNNIYLNHTTI
jgi:hypothetical protein